MRKGIALLLSAGLLAAAGSCDLVKHRDVRRVSIRYCDADSRENWGARRYLLSEAALQYSEAFPKYPKEPQMPYGPGRLANYQVDRLFVDWPKATVRIRARFDLPNDIRSLGERAPVPEDGWYTVRIYLRRENNLWKIDELATKRQWISIVIGETYADAWVELVTGESPLPAGAEVAMIWLRRRLAGRPRIALHPAEECRALLAGSEHGVERSGLLIWAAAIDEAARGAVASGWQSEPGLVIGVLPDESPSLAAAFGEQALRLIAPKGEPHAAYQIGRLTRWPGLWGAVRPRQRRWGRAARARAGDLIGVSLINLDWVQGCLSAAARRRGAQVLADRWESAGADQIAVALTEGDGPVASAFRPVEEWLDALCAAEAAQDILDPGLRASHSGLGRGSRNRAPGA